MSADGKTLWVSSAETSAVAVVDVVSGSVVRTVDGAREPERAIAPEANGSALDPERLERSIDSSSLHPGRSALTPDGKKLYVATGTDVAVMDAERGNLMKRIPVGAGAWGVAIGHGPSR